MTDGYYGEPPVDLGPLDLPEWQEFMHYLYLPVRLPSADPVLLPERLAFLYDPIEDALADAYETTEHLRDPYVYVTARRGFATPGNPLNRPGWHCDDFGGTDLNYIWADRFPTRWMRSDEPLPVPEDDAESMKWMEQVAAGADGSTWRWKARKQFDGNAPRPPITLDYMETGHLWRLTPHVIHDTPLIPEPGGMRSFFKVSVSTHRYNLFGNSHNYLLAYDWPMYDRAEVRNRPQGGNSDYVIEETADA